jgi:hypothetical protein|tara:strand:- start:219 stop:647 length:429 start_codon:yes stop_codon:yes gene_type:complete
MNITLYDYLAYNVPSDCNYLLSRYDYPTSQNEEELVINLKDFVRNYNYEALDALAEIHPDYELIMDVMDMAEMATPYEGKKDGEYLNAAGTIDRIGNIEKTMMTANMDKSTPTTVTEGVLNKIDLLLMIGGAILTATFLKNK